MSSAAPEPIVDLRGVVRHYAAGDEIVRALDGVDIQIKPGEFVAIIGPSGSGKSTAMNLIGCLDKPTAGTVRVAGYNVAELDDDELSSLRSLAVGFVFQQFNLLPRTSVLENVMAPLGYQGVSRSEARERAVAMLTRLGLGERLDADRTQLSGGQQQRVAIARALVTRAPITLADEPTGNLDSVTGAEVIGLLRERRDEGGTVILITHDQEIAAAADRVIRLRDGHVVTSPSAPKRGAGR